MSLLSQLRQSAWLIRHEVIVLMNDVQKSEADDKGAGVSTGKSSLTPCEKGVILLVDDEKAICRLFQMILRSALPDCNIEVAADGAEAIEAFTSVHHSVLVMDLHMPVMDGQTAFIKIQKLCEAKKWDMPSVVFCTGFAPPDVVRGVVAEDARHCILAKPVSGQVLTDTIKDRL